MRTAWRSLPAANVLIRINRRSEVVGTGVTQPRNESPAGVMIHVRSPHPCGPRYRACWRPPASLSRNTSWNARVSLVHDLVRIMLALSVSNATWIRLRPSLTESKRRPSGLPPGVDVVSNAPVLGASLLEVGRCWLLPLSWALIDLGERPDWLNNRARKGLCGYLGRLWSGSGTRYRPEPPNCP